MAERRLRQAWTVLGQAQLKLELELYFTSFKICHIFLIKPFKLCTVRENVWGNDAITNKNWETS